METPVRRKLVAAAAAALAVGGAGAAIAATQFKTSPSQESKAVVSDAAKQLGVQPSELSAALKNALKDRVDAAVADGRLTKEQGDALKKRIDSDQFPLVGAPGFGFGFRGHFGFRDHGFRDHGFRHHGFPGLSTAAKYLGLSEAQLRAKLESGKSLADVAKAQDKSVSGLVTALKGDLQKKLDKAVSEGKLTKEQAARIMDGAGRMITAVVNGKFPGPPPNGKGFFREHRGFGPGMQGGPPPAAPGMDA
jgi:polyhydroxyalkanoate synthesis regulator phasin